MSEVQILHNPRCSKSRQTLELLLENNLKPTITEYLKDSPTPEEIKNLAGKLDLNPSQFLRKGEYAKLGIQMAESEAGLIQQMAKFPILIERPIVIHGSRAKIGRPPESVLEIL